MMVSHAGDINPYPLDGRRRFVARRIAPPEGHPIRAVNGFDLRPEICCHQSSLPVLCIPFQPYVYRDIYQQTH
jgi:hypothetical protein